MTPELTQLLAILAGGIVLVVLGIYWWMQRTPPAHEHSDAPLPLFGGLQPGERFTPPQGQPPIRQGRPERLDAPLPPVVPFRAPPTPPESVPVIPSTPAPSPPRSSPAIREFTTGKSKAAPTPKPATAVAPQPKSAPKAPPAPPLSTPSTATDSAVVSEAGVPGTMVEGHGLRFSVPAEGTLQFLPGRFEIGSGLDAGREIRFVHVPGPNGMEVTFGRSEGELYRHIQLRDKTVSRQHARMQLRDGAWFLTNLSTTNPVAWNGRELASQQEQRLADGDRIEMGEVAFTFRSR